MTGCGKKLVCGAVAGILAACQGTGAGAEPGGESGQHASTTSVLSSRAPQPGGGAEDGATTRGAVLRLTARYGERLRGARYMEQGGGEAVEWPGWKGFPTRKYRYSRKDSATGVEKQADVVLLDASAEQIARWVVTACSEARGGEVRDADADRLFEHVIGQSGGQFPVAGVVYEDILPADGKYEIYCFRDGVTVAVEGVPHRGTDPLDDAQISASLTGKVAKVYRYARIQSTSPSEYLAGGGTVDVGTDGDRKSAWLDVVRSSYQNAWTSDRYSLMSDWARSHLK